MHRFLDICAEEVQFRRGVVDERGGQQISRRMQAHHSYASMNWIRFNGLLRRVRRQQYLSPLAGHPG